MSVIRSLSRGDTFVSDDNTNESSVPGMTSADLVGTWAVESDLFPDSALSCAPIVTDLADNTSVEFAPLTPTNDTNAPTIASFSPGDRTMGDKTTDAPDASATSNAAVLDTDSRLNPSLTVNAANPADVLFTVSGLASDYSGKVTFTDTTGKADVVSIGGNGTYSANLSNLANGTLTYLMTVSNPAGNVINVDPTATLGDGSANAPAGTPEFPNLLNGYAVRPSWEVAGVDYYVGVPANAVLSDPSTLSSNPNISVNSSTHQISAYGSGYTISNINFALDGGWQLILHGSNITVEDCNFAIGSNGNAMLNDNVGGINNTIQYSTFNANGLTDNYNDADIYILGPATVEYCRIENASSDLVDVGGSGSSVQDITLKYNMLVNAGQASGTHPDWLQLGGGTYTVDVESNTFYQTAAVNGPGTQGIFTDAGNNGASLVGANIISNNTIVTLAGARVNYAIGALASSGSGNTFSISNNYINPTGVEDSVFKYTSSQNTQTDNVNMVTGALVGQNATSVTQVVASPASGVAFAGNTITLTLDLSSVATVTGTPTLTLNDGGTANYTSGSGTDALTFTYTVGASDTSVSALAITQVNLPSGAKITDSNGNAVVLYDALVTFSDLQIDPTSGLTIGSITESPASGDLNAGKTVTLTLNLSEAVTVTGGTPTLALNDGGTATYTGGSGSNALTFSYTVAAGQNTSGLAATAVNLNSATVADGAGNTANLSLTGLTQSGPQIDTLTPTISSLTESPASGDLNAGKTVTLTLNLSEAVTVTGGTPTLALNDGGTATYTSGSGSNALTFSYTVAAGQNTSGLAATAVNLNSATVTDGASNTANLSLSGLTQSGPQIDTLTPTISSLTESPASGDLNAGKTVTLTLNLSEAVTVTGGTPTLALNDGGTATNTGGSGTNSLTFSYTVAAGQNTSALAATAVNLDSATVKDGAGNVATLSLSGLTQSGPQIDTTTPTISALTESPASGDLNAGKTVTLTLNLNEAVTVAGGTPTLALNDGGTATYAGGSGTNALTFSYTVAAGQNTSGLAATAINLNSATVTDSAGNAANLSLSGLTQGGPQIDSTIPSVTAASASPSSGVETPGNHVTLTLTMSEAVAVVGTPTLSLNDGGTATYTSGSGTNALTFAYTVGAGDGAVSNLSIIQANLPNRASITDGAGNAASLAGAIATFSGLQIDPGSTVTSVVETPASGDFSTGEVVTFTLNLSEAVTVTGGTPTLTLNDGGTATYTGGSGSNALTFSYTVGAGQNTTALAATAVNLNSATITDGAGNAANLSLSGLTQNGPQIDTTTPSIASLTETPSTGDLVAGKTVTFTLNLNEAVTVAGGTPTLTLNDGGVATYTGGSGSNALTFSYAVGTGQNTASLAATAVNLNSATVTDGAGVAANLSLSGLTQSGPQIDTTTPTIVALAESPADGDLNAGKVVTITLDMSEVVMVKTGGTPTLSLNDGGVATYTGGSGSDALTFSYTVGAGQNTTALAATAVNLNSATIADGAGNAANLSLSGLTQSGPQIDTTTPTIASLTETPSTGDLIAGKTVTFTLNLNEAVTVAGGTPTLTLNDGGVATYTGGSGSNALTFSYAVGAGQNTASLAATAVNLNSATVTDGAGVAANLSLSGLTQSGPQIDTTTPTVSSLAELPASGDLNAGKTVTLTLNLNEAVTVSGGTPTLTLNDGGTATYTGGSGSNALTFSYTVAAGQNTAGLAPLPSISIPRLSPTAPAMPPISRSPA